MVDGRRVGDRVLGAMVLGFLVGDIETGRAVRFLDLLDFFAFVFAPLPIPFPFIDFIIIIIIIPPFPIPFPFPFLLLLGLEEVGARDTAGDRVGLFVGLIGAREGLCVGL
jgi:hypothetical protein